MYTEARLKPLTFLILYSRNPSGGAAARPTRNAYFVLGLAVISAAALGTVLFLVPRIAGAFWPFTRTEAASAADDIIVHDADLDLLKAAIHSDPNPSKGGATIAMTEGSALIANSGPEGTVAHVEGTSGGRISLYEVREGDSLSEIADMFGVSTNTILWANDLAGAGSIHPGMSLVILPVSGVRHEVLSGQTLKGIANKYGADVDEVARYNGLDVSESLAVGTEIIIPGGEVETKKVATATKKTSTSSAKSSAASSRSLPAISGFFGNPLPGGRLSQGIHGYNGVDIAAPAGTPIYAAAGGTVIVARNNGGYNGGYGNYIVIDHGNGTQTLYAHMSSTAVSGGDVGKGALIGYVGNTGKSTGNHLHFEVRGAKNPFGK